MSDTETVDYKQLYENTKKDLRTLKGFAKSSASQNKLFKQLLSDVLDASEDQMDINENSYECLKNKLLTLKIGGGVDSSATPTKKSTSVTSSDSNVNCSPSKLLERNLDNAFDTLKKSLEVINGQNPGEIDSGSDAAETLDIETVREQMSLLSPESKYIYTENDMHLALKKLRDDIISACEQEAMVKLQKQAEEFEVLKLNYIRELEKLRMSCSTCPKEADTIGENSAPVDVGYNASIENKNANSVSSAVS